MFEQPGVLDASLEELRKLGTNPYRKAEDDERFVQLYVDLQSYYASEGKLEEFQQFCRKHLAVAQHKTVLRLIRSLLVPA